MSWNITVDNDFAFPPEFLLKKFFDLEHTRLRHEVRQVFLTLQGNATNRLNFDLTPNLSLQRAKWIIGVTLVGNWVTAAGVAPSNAGQCGCQFNFTEGAPFNFAANTGKVIFPFGTNPFRQPAAQNGIVDMNVCLGALSSRPNLVAGVQDGALSAFTKVAVQRYSQGRLFFNIASVLGANYNGINFNLQALINMLVGDE